MTKNFLVNLLMFEGVLHFACSVSVSENPDPLGLLYHDESKESSPSVEENFLLKTYDPHSADKNYYKRRMVFKDPNVKDLDSSGDSEKHPETREYDPRRKNNYNDNENDKTGFDKYREVYRDNDRSKYSYGSGLDQPRESEGTRAGQFYKEQPNLKSKYDWENRDVAFEDRQPLVPEGYSNRYPKDYSVMGDLNDFERRGGAVVDSRDMRKSKNFNNGNDLLKTMHTAYSVYPKMNYNGLYSTEYYNPEKGLIINFNTECPVTTTQGKHRYSHKYVFAPKPNINSQTEMSSFHMPDSSVLTSSNPFYYSY